MTKKASNNIQTTFAPDYFADLAKAATSLSLSFEKEKFIYSSYRGADILLSQVLQRMAGIGRMPYFANEKTAEEFLKCTLHLDGHKNLCTAKPPVTVSEKLVRYAAICLKMANEPVLDWCHFRSQTIPLNKLLFAKAD